MSTYKGTIKKWNTASWDVMYPQTTIDQVIDLASSIANMQAEIDTGIDRSIRYVVGNTTGTAGYWTGTIADITALYEGLVVAYKIGIAGASTTYLNINAYGNKQVLRNTGALTTHLVQGTIVLLTYNGTNWVWADYDSDDVYTLRNSYQDISGVDPIYSYKIVMQGSDGALYPLTKETGTGLTKTVSNRNFLIGGKIYGYVTSATIAANTLTRYYMAESVSQDGLYTFNSSSGFVAGKPIYIVGVVQSDGTFMLNNQGVAGGIFYTQTLPTTDDGKIYIRLGIMHDTTRYIKITVDHPIYEFKNGKVRQYVSTHEHPWSDVTGKPTTLGGYGITDLTSHNSANPINPANSVANAIGYANNISLFGQSDGGLFNNAYSEAWQGQIFQDFRTGQIAVRGKNSGTWQAWRTIRDNVNFLSGIDFAPAAAPVVAAKTADHTLVLDDANKFLQMNASVDRSIIIPTNASVAFPIGTEIHVARLHPTANTVFYASSGVTIQSEGSKLKINAQYQVATIKKIATDTWLLFGALKS